MEDFSPGLGEVDDVNRLPLFYWGAWGKLTEENPEMSASCQEQWLRVAHACLKIGQVLRTNQSLVPPSQQLLRRQCYSDDW